MKWDVNDFATGLAILLFINAEDYVNSFMGSKEVLKGLGIEKNDKEQLVNELMIIRLYYTGLIILDAKKNLIEDISLRDKVLALMYEFFIDRIREALGEEKVNSLNKLLHQRCIEYDEAREKDYWKREEAKREGIDPNFPWDTWLQLMFKNLTQGQEWTPDRAMFFVKSMKEQVDDITKLVENYFELYSKNMDPYDTHDTL